MKDKLNIAEFLKYCPKGMELDCTMFDNVVFEKIDFISSPHPIIIRRTDSNKTIHLTKYGQYSAEEDYKCIIFPKGKTTWEGFVPPCKFKDGDIIIEEYLGSICIYKNDAELKGTVNYYCGILSSGDFKIKDKKYPKRHFGCIEYYHLATEEEKQKLFDAIKANGYCWNAETKTLEKLIKPKFKVGDRIRHKTTNKDDIYEISEVYDDSYGLVGFIWMIYMEYQDQYELAPNKFDITTLIPFESRVLVREDKTDVWIPAFYGFFHQQDKCFYTTIRGTWSMCIPYNEDTKHLIGTTNDCDEYYKTW